MSSRAKTRLHLAKNLDELNNMTGELPNILNVKAYLKTAEAAFKKAGDWVTMGDEESAYVMYTKYMHIVTCVQKMSEFKKNEAAMRAMVVEQHYRQAVSEAKRLAGSLNLRYNERHAHQLAEQRQELELERAKLQVREARLETQRVVVAEPEAAIGWQVTTDVDTGLPKYEVIRK